MSTIYAYILIRLYRMNLNINLMELFYRRARFARTAQLSRYQQSLVDVSLCFATIVIESIYELIASSIISVICYIERSILIK